MPRRIHQNRSLSEVHETVDFSVKSSKWRRWLAVSGPALLVAVGYMDPGNWATDIFGGSRYNYTLIWVLLMSNLMAILLQSMAARLGIVSRRDLAQINHEEYPPLVNYALYGLAEIAITACDLAEVLGSAIALQLLFGIPLLVGVILTALDTFLLLLLSQFGIRKLEAVVLSLVSTIGVAFLIEIVLGQPDWGGVLRGFVPSIPDSTALYIGIGILGATVMPHNLYLHSSLVQTRKVANNHTAINEAIRWNNIDVGVSMNVALLINAAILMMAASVFYRNGLYNVSVIQDAYRLLEPILGAAIAPVAFGVALLASGQASTITGTLAGQIVMEGYLNLRIRPWLRRLITRLLAVIPAVIVISRLGEGSTGNLLVLSQVVLSLQLPFAVIPLIHAVADKERMGKFVIKAWMQALGWVVAAIILVLNIKLIMDQVSSWISESGAHAWLIESTLIPLLGLLGLLALYVTVHPWLDERFGGRAHGGRLVDVHKGGVPLLSKLSVPKPYRRIAIALDFSGKEEKLLNEALRFAEERKTALHLLHVVESPVALTMGAEGSDQETVSDQARLDRVVTELGIKGFKAQAFLGAGNPADELSRLIIENADELVILGAHGHSGVSDLAYGSTVDAVRHRVKAKVLVVPLDT